VNLAFRSNRHYLIVLLYFDDTIIHARNVRLPGLENTTLQRAWGQEACIIYRIQTSCEK